MKRILIFSGTTEGRELAEFLRNRQVDVIVRGSEVDILLHPKIKFEVVVSSEEWEQKTISAIQKAAFTGEVGDGKIFSYEIRSAVKIRTKETGYNAVQSQDNL